VRKWTGTFDGPAFDARWGLDTPDPAVAQITLDTANDWARVTATGNTDMWTTRNNAPILWTDSPAGDFFMETHVMSPTTQGQSVAGLTVYGDGVGSDDGEKPNFSLGLDHWNVNGRIVKLQGLGTNNPNIFQSATGGEAWLRLELYRDGGAGGVDRYAAKYKLAEADPWALLAVLDRDVDNARMGMVMKTGGGGGTSDFSYFASGEQEPPPAPTTVWDFESGDLTGWNVLTSGVPGDNLVFTTAGNQPAALPHSGSFDDATIQGTHWIRTWEGEVLGTGDGHTGVIETDSFVLGDDALFTMLIGGGNHAFTGDPDTIEAGISAVNLEREVSPGDWEMIFTATGTNANALSPRAWDASAFAGDTVRLRIYDTHDSGWGHIDADNIQYFAGASAAVPEPSTWILLALGGLGFIGYGWRKRR